MLVLDYDPALTTFSCSLFGRRFIPDPLNPQQFVAHKMDYPAIHCQSNSAPPFLPGGWLEGGLGLDIRGWL
ncbi:hypothetical protein [Dictyobacter kobayashii]|uniref:hypothetical protein n=1 Tax=Dictyobacter kobayashii TaxID=2014872 RepID=UPI00138737C8|nr:hypothetical protein [Dictyobacter kobayashii]